MKLATLLQLPILFSILIGCGQSDKTYDAFCAASPPGFRTPSEGLDHLRPYLSIQVNSGGLLTWAGTPITDDQLASYVHQAGNLNPQPQLVLEVASKAPCVRVERVREILLSSSICKGVRLCSEGRNPKNWRITGGP